MLRSAAREIAVHISFLTGINPLETEELLDIMFDKEYYKTLKDEVPVYSDYPNKKQLEYIRRLAIGVSEHLAELDSYIEKYAKNWKVERISRTAIAIMRVSMFEILYMPDIPKLLQSMRLCSWQRNMNSGKPYPLSTAYWEAL